MSMQPHVPSKVKAYSMKHITIILAFLMTLANPVTAIEQRFSDEDCRGVYAGIVSLLGEANKNWEDREQNPIGSPDYVKHTNIIKWTVDVAANYTTIYEAFCAKVE